MKPPTKLPILPTTMVGSYPRPSWFTWQLEGRDVLEAFEVSHHREAFEDAMRVVIADQEEAGLDVLTDGQMWFDDYEMGIGSFLWYWLERTSGFATAKVPHPARAKAKGRDEWALDEAGGVEVVAPIARGPVRLAALYSMAQNHTDKPIKACVGAGPVQLSTSARGSRRSAARRTSIGSRASSMARSRASTRRSRGTSVSATSGAIG